MEQLQEVEKLDGGMSRMTRPDNLARRHVEGRIEAGEPLRRQSWARRAGSPGRIGMPGVCVAARLLNFKSVKS
ncbi:MAG TPA: hypothetical protein VLD67_13055, partial [Vicinamibacterales bacterium]|nr:hypothetical protein [Vicinamibacterales bacterium]